MAGACSDDTVSFNVMRNGGTSQLRCAGTMDRLLIANNTINPYHNPTSCTGITLQCSGSVEVKNNIIMYAGDGAVRDEYGIATFEYNCVHKVGSRYPDLPIDGTTNFRADPMLCDSAGGDFHLNALSPCSPRNTVSGQLIGALGVACGDLTCGDTNGDSEGNYLDVEYLSDLYFGYQMPFNFVAILGDMDCDGRVTIADLILLSGYVYGYGPDPCCVEPPPPPPEHNPIKR